MTGSLVPAPTGRRMRRTWRPGPREVHASMIEVSYGGHPAFPPGAVRPTAVRITWERSQPLKLGLQVVTRSEFLGGRERSTGNCRPLSRALAENGAPRPMKMGHIVPPWRYDAMADYEFQPT